VAALEIAHVNLVVAIFIWVMIYPMMIQIDFARDQGRRARSPRGLVLTLVVNWLVKPFTMAALGRAVLRTHLRALGRPPFGQRVHRRHDPARRGAVHGDGVRVEPAGEGRPQLHPGAGVGERPHHGLRLRADRSLPARASPTSSVPWETLLLSTVLYVVLPLAGRDGDAACAGAALGAGGGRVRRLASSPGPSSA
jgi:ACR3 family arsenite transporter